MLKRIQRHAVRPGMYIEDFEGEWRDNPLARRRFTIRGDEDIEGLKQSTSISAVIINTARGVDVYGAPEGESRDIQGLRSAALVAAQDANERRRTLQSVRETSDALHSLFDGVSIDGSLALSSVGPLVDDVQATMQRNPLVLLGVTRIKSKDETTYVHSLAVSALMVHLCQHLDFDDATIKLMGMAGLLHDIGKTRIPDAVLNKQGGLLPEELAIIRDHPALGHEILSRQADMPHEILDICRHHHERLDGKGYPDGLSGGAISKFVRISTVCDVYDAVVRRRMI